MTIARHRVPILKRRRTDSGSITLRSSTASRDDDDGLSSFDDSTFTHVDSDSASTDDDDEMALRATSGSGDDEMPLRATSDTSGSKRGGGGAPVGGFGGRAPASVCSNSRSLVRGGGGGGEQSGASVSRRGSAVALGGGSGAGEDDGGGGGGDALADSSPANCPLCWEEQPYVGDSGLATAMIERLSDFRRVIFRFERLMCGRQHDDTVFRGMLELRRLFIERYLDSYSSQRFRRWTMAMLREHYDPVKGHRFDVVRELDAELGDLRLLRRWKMERAMFVLNPETGALVFNVRAVDVRLRVSRQYTDVLKHKAAELRQRHVSTAQTDANLVLQAVNGVINQHGGGGGGGGDSQLGGVGGASALASIAEHSVASVYEVGGV